MDKKSHITNRDIDGICVEHNIEIYQLVKILKIYANKFTYQILGTGEFEEIDFLDLANVKHCNFTQSEIDDYINTTEQINKFRETGITDAKKTVEWRKSHLL